MARTVSSSSSSPDPIAIPGSEEATRTLKELTSRRSATPKKPLLTRNGNIQLQDFYLATPHPGRLQGLSPGRSIAHTENLLSPYRIRVTVEAERTEDDEMTRTPSKSPSKRAIGRAITTTVPLRNPEDSSPSKPKMGRGKSRKSVATPLVRRVGTPGHKNMMRNTMAEDVEDPEPTSALKATTPTKRRGGRPRKITDVSVRTQSTLEEVVMVPDVHSSPASGAEPGAGESAAAWKSTGRRSSPSRRRSSRISTLESHATSKFTEQTDQTKRITTPQVVIPLRQSQSPNKSPRMAKMLQNPTEEHEEFDTIMESEGFTMISLDSLPSAQIHLTSEVNINNSRGNSKLGVGKSVRESPGNLDTGSHEKSIPGDARPESVMASSAAGVQSAPTPPSTTTNSSQLYQIMNQRNPSQMYSSPSLPPPMQQARPSTFSQALNESTSGTLKLTDIARPGTTLQGAVISTTSHSETKADSAVSVQIKEISEPSFRPKALERHDNDIFSGFGKVTRRELKAGLRLGEELARTSTSADIEGDSEPSPRPISSKSNSNDVFGGFGAGTRRELRAGLRLGEELAKKQQLSAQMLSTPNLSSQDDVFQDDSNNGPRTSPTPEQQDEYTLSLPSGRQNQVVYPTLPKQQLPSPDRTDEGEEDHNMMWKNTSPQSKDPVNAVQVRRSSASINGEEIDRTMMAREAEWQREREAVSRQIQDANTSQVIVIDSCIMDESHDTSDDDGDVEEEEDEEDEEAVMCKDEDTVDIWQSEAKQSSQLETGSSVESPTQDLFLEQATRPRRSKLPSPWRKKEKMIYSDEIAEELKYPVLKPLPKPFVPSYQASLKHFATPRASDNRKRARYDASSYSILSEFAIQPNDESSLMGDKGGRSSENDEAIPLKPNKSPKLSHMDENDQVMVEALDESLTVSPSDINLEPLQAAASESSYVRLRPEDRKPAEPSPKTSNPEPLIDAASEPSYVRLRPDDRKSAEPSSNPKNPEPLPAAASESSYVHVRQDKLKSDKSSTEPIEPSTSWLRRITNYVPLFKTLASPAPSSPAKAPTTSAPSAFTSIDPPPSPAYVPQEPPKSKVLSIYLPWTSAHYRLLQDIYLSAQQHPSKYQHNPRSTSAYLLGSEIESMGWRKGLDAWDLGVVDAFMNILTRRGVDDGVGIEAEMWEMERINEEEVARRVFSLWVGQVQRGEAPVGKGTVGMFDERLQWRKKGILEAAARANAAAEVR